MPQEGVSEVLLFGEEHGPYGDAALNPRRPGSYHRTMHGIVSGRGFTPFFAATSVDWASSSVVTVRSYKEWRDQVSYARAGTYILASGGEQGAVTFKIDTDGTISADRTHGGSRTIREDDAGICSTLHSNGGTTPLYIVAFGSTANIESRDQAGTWEGTAWAGTPAQANGLFSENGNLWAVLTNGYQVRKWAAGVDPRTGTAGAAIDVGTSAYPITGIGLLGGSRVVCVKADGIYIYDIDTDRFENIYAGLAENPHPDTGKGTYTWGNMVVVPLGYGGHAVIIDRNGSPIPASAAPREAKGDYRTPARGKLGAFTSDEQYLYATATPFWRRAATPGLQVLTVDHAQTFNDRTAAVTDFDPATNFTLADLEGAGFGVNNYIYVGDDDPFECPWFGCTPASAAAINSVEYYDGDAAAWTSIGTYTDYTDGLFRDGAILPDTPIPSTWATTAVDGNTKYWWRINLSAAIPTTNEVREVRVLPREASLPGGTGVTQAALDDASCRTHILRGYPTAQGFHWDDIASLPGDYSGGLVMSQLLADGSEGKTLVAIGPSGYARMFLGNSGDPEKEAHADVANGFASLLYLPADDRLSDQARAPTIVKQLEYVDVYCRGFDPDNDLVQVWAQWDDEDPVLVGEGRKAYSRIPVASQETRRGLEYAITVGVTDGAAGQRVAQVTKVLAGVKRSDRTPGER